MLKGIIYAIYNAGFGMLETWPELCKCEDQHKLETFSNLYNLVQMHLKV